MTTRFPIVMNDEEIYKDIQAELRDKLIVYMLDTDNPKTKEFLEILDGPAPTSLKSDYRTLRSVSGRDSKMILTASNGST